MLDHYETFALDHFLTAYPTKWDFERILEALEAGSEQVVVWEPFENFPSDFVTDLIDSMADQLRQTFPYAGPVPLEVRT